MSHAPRSLNTQMRGILRDRRRASTEAAAIFGADALERERHLRVRLLALAAASLVAMIGFALFQ